MSFEFNAPEPKPESREPAKNYRSPDSYSVSEIAGMPTDERASIQARQAVQRFYRWLDLFEKSWGFKWNPGGAQVLPTQELTDQDVFSLRRASGKSEEEIRSIASRAKAQRAER